jgi:long-chain acyl-CoA synthetase
VPASRTETLAEKELEAFCRQHLESFKVPSNFHFHQSLPKSPLGKVLRQALRTAVMNAA